MELNLSDREWLVASILLGSVVVGLVVVLWLKFVPAPGERAAPSRVARSARWRGLRALLGVAGAALEAADRARLREVLIGADLGSAAADKVLGRLKPGGEPLEVQLERVLAELLAPAAADPDAVPAQGVLILVGINGSGKTTTIAKLAKRWTNQGRTVVLGAADTFRAAAAEQLAAWGERLGVRVVRQQSGADPAAVAFDAIQAAQTAGAMTIVDTAGRIHGDQGLMGELQKIVRVAGKAREGAPDVIWLTLDASQGQTAVEQARRFAEAVDVTGVVLNKVDGEGRAGFAVRVAVELGLPLVGLGVGEGMDDFVPFDAATFAHRLVAGDDGE